MDIDININLKDHVNINKIKKIIFLNYLIYYFLMFIFLILAILVIKSNLFISIIFFILAFISLILALRLLFFKNKEKVIQSKLVKEYIRKNKLTKEEIIKIKFKYDPIYHDKVINKNKIEKDRQYYLKVSNATNKYNRLVAIKKELILNIKKNRWTDVVENKFSYNLLEGKIKINNEEFKFNQIKKCKIDSDFSKDYITTKNHSSSAGLYYFNDNKKDDFSRTFLYGKANENVSITTEEIEYCQYLVICVLLDDVEREIVLINKRIDKNTKEYMELVKLAKMILKDLRKFARIKQERKYLEVEQEFVVLKYDKLIETAKKELELAILDRPKYEIDKIYLL